MIIPTIFKPIGVRNPYVWFGYGPHNIFKHTQGQAFGIKDMGIVNVKSQHNSQQCFDGE